MKVKSSIFTFFNNKLGFLMIAHLKGQLVELELTNSVIDVGGVGYYVDIPMSTYDRLPKVGAPVTLFTVNVGPKPKLTD